MNLTDYIFYSTGYQTMLLMKGAFRNSHDAEGSSENLSKRIYVTTISKSAKLHISFGFRLVITKCDISAFAYS